MCVYIYIACLYLCFKKGYVCIYLHWWIKYLWKDTGNGDWLSRVREDNWNGWNSHVFHCKIWIYHVYILHFPLKSEFKFPVKRKTYPRYAYLCSSCPNPLHSTTAYSTLTSYKKISWQHQLDLLVFLLSELFWHSYFSIAWYTIVLCIMFALSN